MKKYYLSAMAIIILLSFSYKLQAQQGEFANAIYFRILGGYCKPQTTRETNISQLPGEIEVKGSGPIARFQLGYSIIPDVIIYFEIGGIYMRAPNLIIAGQEFTPQTYTRLQKTNYMIIEYGLGGTYYFTSFKFFIAASFTASQNKYGYEDSGKIIYTYPGIGINGILGKEWSISTNLGIGISLFYHMSGSFDQRDQILVKNKVYGIATSFTFRVWTFK